jgi:glycine betaine/proline transport system permease protein
VTAISLPAARRVEAHASRRAWWLALAVLVTALYLLLRGQAALPHEEDTQTFRALNGVRDWVDANRTTSAVFVFIVNVIRQGVAGLVALILALLDGLGWVGVLAVAASIGLASGGRRIALLAMGGLVSLGVLGLWEESIDTLGLTLAAVVLSLAIGIPLGIVAGRSDRFSRAITPVLDVMQIMPTFAYLAPMALFFLIGSPSATIATLIYAMPAAIRITALGIRLVPSETVEAARSLGSSRWQLLRKVQLPLARRAIGLAINQTIMLALSMVVITALIDAPGLGKTITFALERLDVGAALDAGLAIVILAIVLDRLTEHAGRRLDPRWRIAGGGKVAGRRTLLGVLAVAAAAVAAGLAIPAIREFPDALSFSFRGPVNAATDWIAFNLFFVTGALKNVFTGLLLNPLQGILTTAPWWLVVGLVFNAAVLISGRRAALSASACLVLIAWLGLWEHGMVTLATVLVATAITLALGIVFGILSARSDRFAAILRPTLDAAQTMPPFVYLLPALALFGATRFTAIVAAVIFATPPVIRLVDAGIRSVPAAILEAAASAGASPWQLLWKVQLPVSRPALLLAANQGIVMVLGMVVIGGLVGAGALGYDVVAGFAQREDFGKGLAAGVSIVLLGIMLDRITQGAGRRPAAAVRQEG